MDLRRLGGECPVDREGGPIGRSVPGVAVISMQVRPVPSLQLRPGIRAIRATSDTYPDEVTAPLPYLIPQSQPYRSMPARCA